jgi:hypothetical protein
VMTPPEIIRGNLSVMVITGTSRLLPPTRSGLCWSSLPRYLGKLDRNATDLLVSPRIPKRNNDNVRQDQTHCTRGASDLSFHSGTAFDQNHFTAFPVAFEYQSNQAINRLKAKIPSKAFGSVNDQAGASFGRSQTDVVCSGKVVGRDPDANVRFEILRDGQYATSR